MHSTFDWFCDEHHLGWVWPADNGYQCFPTIPNWSEGPTSRSSAQDRLPGDALPTGYVRIAPDLAVEVVSPDDLASELDEKLDDYQKAGVRLVWVIYPESRTVSVYRGDGSASRLHEDGVLSGEDVIAGFRCRLALYFRRSLDLGVTSRGRTGPRQDGRPDIRVSSTLEPDGAWTRPVG